MRVWIVSPHPTGGGGGVEQFCHTLRRSLAAETGWDVQVVGRAGEPGAPPPDCAITNGMTGLDRRGIPRVHVYHGCWPEHMRYDHVRASPQWRLKRRLQGAIREIGAGRGALRVSVSRSAAREIRRWYGLNSVVVPNCVDTAVFRPTDRAAARRSLGVPLDRRLALFPGRPEDRKRPDLAVAACRRASFTLLHAGTAPLPGAEELGRLSAAELAAWYAAVDVVLAPSDYEAASLAVLEALAVGTPVVGTRVGWLRDLEFAVPGYRPLLADRGDLDGLTRSLNGLDAASTAVRDAAELVRREHDFTSLGSRYADLVRQAVGR